MHHSFDLNIACKYGVPVAIIMNNFFYWINHNLKNKRNYHDGRYWTYNSIKALQDLFPYYTVKQIRNIIQKAVDQNLIIIGNYNEDKYDRTSWYAFTDKALKLFNFPESIDEVEDNSSPICPNGQMDVPKKANQSAQKGKCYNESDVNTDINKKAFVKNDQKTNSETKQEQVDRLIATYAKPNPKPERRNYDNDRKHSWANKPEAFSAVNAKPCVNDIPKKDDVKKSVDYEKQERALMQLPPSLRPKRLRNSSRE